MVFTKKIFENKLEKIKKNDPVLAERTDLDNNNILKLIYINSFVRISKLIITIMNITIFVASFM
jgi:hypothetical protein